MTDARLSLLCKGCGTSVPLFNLESGGDFYMTSPPEKIEDFMNTHAKGYDCAGDFSRLAVPSPIGAPSLDHDLEPCVEVVGLWGQPGWRHPDREYRPIPWADLRNEVEGKHHRE